MRPAPRSAVLVVLAIAAPLAGCSDFLDPTNPYDPQSINPAPGSIRGTVQAVFARDEGGNPRTPGACEAVDGDHSGFTVVVRGVRDDGDGINAPSAETNASGEFLFQNVPPGRYTLELVREGFSTPPVVEFSVDVAQERNLGVFCALNATGPARPVLSFLPSVISANVSPPTLSVEGVDLTCNSAGPGCPVRYVVSQTVDGTDTTTVTEITVDSLQGDGGGTWPQLVLGAGPGTRRTVRVDVRAVDALGNESEPALATVIVDAIAPPPPTELNTAAGRDRVTLSWLPGPAATTSEDDGAAAYVVSYGLAPRVEGQGCPYGAPVLSDTGVVEDSSGSASFALEGPSPLLTTGTSQQLSGIAPGTELVMHVAALDTAGNAGCYSEPVRARPDDVTFVLSEDVRSGVVVSGTVAMGTVGGVNGAIISALGDGGSRVLPPNGMLVSNATPAFDVAVDGDDVYFASGALGVRRITLDETGAPIAASERTLASGTTARSILALPSRIAIGTNDGVRILDPESGIATDHDAGERSEPVIALRAWGPFLVVVREVGSQARVQLVDRTVPDVARAELSLNVKPSAVLVHADAIWLALGSQGVVAHELRGCETESGPCLGVVGRRSLPGGLSAQRLSGYDDRVIVSARDGTRGVVVALARDSALTVKGRADVGEGEPRALFTDDGRVCVALARSPVDALTCAASVSTFFVDEERRYASGRSIFRARAAAGVAYAIEKFDELSPAVVTTVDLDSMTPIRTAELPDNVNGVPAEPVAATPLDDGSLLVLDNVARLYVISPTTSGTVTPFADLAADVATLFPSIGNPEDPTSSGLDGLIERRGSTLFLALSTQGDVDAEETLAGVLRLRLREDAGRVRVAAPTAADAVDVPGAIQFTRVLLEPARVIVSTQPFGLVSISTSGSLAVVNEETVAPSGGRSSFAADAAFIELNGGRSLVVPGKRPLPGGGEGAGLFAIDLETGGPPSPGIQALGAPTEIMAEANSLCVLRNRLVVGTEAQGVFVLSDVNGDGLTWVPVAALPSASQVTEPTSTARGVLVADGPGGLLFSVFR